MKTNQIFTILFSLFMLSQQSNAQNRESVKNYLGVKSPIVLQNNTYQLAFSSHPSPTFYKHEYLAKGDAFPKYKSMITIDFLVTESTLDKAVAQKISELEQLKKANYDVNFEVITNKATGEKIVDCLIGQTAPDELNSVIERDIYRFKLVKAKNGQAGILLLASSTRKYGNDIRPFLIVLKTDKPVLVKEIANLPVPELNI